MVEPETVQEMFRLKGLGYGTRRIAEETGHSRTTVQRYMKAGGWTPFAAGERDKLLDGLEKWLHERFLRHAGNADVVRQELVTEKNITVSLRTVERAVEGWRAELIAAAVATVRFETPPGRQMQIDFGERFIDIGGKRTKVYLFVATLGFSRRVHVRAFTHERQKSWFDGLESAFRAFGGVTEDVLIDNARALVDDHDRETREVTFNARFKAFAKHWGFTPKACAPYRARTKGKTENGVGYVKKNAIAGRAFESFAALEAHLEQWTREIADVRVHGTTGEAPRARFDHHEAAALKSIVGTGPFETTRELRRTVTNDCAVEVDTNFYSVPWKLIGQAVLVLVTAGRVRIEHGGLVVAEHACSTGRRERIRIDAHLEGVGGTHRVRPVPIDPAADEPAAPLSKMLPPSALQRSLGDYEAVAGGSF
jgi:transposase